MTGIVTAFKALSLDAQTVAYATSIIRYSDAAYMLIACLSGAQSTDQAGSGCHAGCHCAGG
jgi:hypothetical protein